MAKFDPEVLIGLIKFRPCLWDKSLDTHKDFLIRSHTWMDICKMLNPAFDDLERRDKKLYVKAIMKKWSNLRDNWKKTYDKKDTKPYIYHEKMQFLEKNLNYKKKNEPGDEKNIDTIINKNDENNVTDEKSTDNLDSEKYEDSDESDSVAGHKSKKTKREEQEDCTIQFMDNSLRNEDAHVSFIKSLLPTLSKLSEDDTLEFQAGVIKLLQDIRTRSRIKTCSSPCYNMASPSFKKEYFQNISE